MAENQDIAVFTTDFARRVERVVKLVESFRMSGPGVRFHKGGSSMSAFIAASLGGGGSVTALLIVGIENDHLRCKRFDDAGLPIGEELLVAKPPELRHDAAYYENVDTLITDDASTVTLTFNGGEEDETWTIKPPYLTDDEPGKHPTEILVTQSLMARHVVVGDETLVWQDLNVAGRVWGVVG